MAAGDAEFVEASGDMDRPDPGTLEGGSADPLYKATADPVGEGTDVLESDAGPVPLGHAHEPENHELRATEVPSAGLHELVEVFERRVAGYERTISELHSTVERLQRDQLQGMMKPSLQSFVSLHAELLAAADHARGGDGDRYAGDFDYFAQAVEGVLDQFDLESVGAAPGADFDRRAHAAVLVKPTADAAKDQTIARVVRQGFRIVGADRVLFPARVVVWKHDEGAVRSEDQTLAAGIPDPQDASRADTQAVAPLDH